MAVLTPGRDMLVLRLVYDGPPRSGKTTSLKLLAGSLSRQIVSPEEADGRTLLFDWVDYVGGSYEGLPIRCQLIGVPGQRVLARRRQALLATADAVVFVADTTRRGMAETEISLRELRAFVATRQAPRPGVVVQANKRDEPDAEPLPELRARLHAGNAGGIALVESVATEGTGIREAFVLSVRLALDRVRELAAAGALEARPPEAETADDLIAQIRATDRIPVPAAASTTARSEPMAAQAWREVLATEDDLVAFPPRPATIHARPAAPPSSVAVPTLAGIGATAATTFEPRIDPPDRQAPRLPGVAAPSGRVWPPVEGRLVLHAALSAALPGATGTTGSITPLRRPDGSWQARIERWRLHSLADHEFGTLEDGREELLRWARLFATKLQNLSSQRCIVLAESGIGSWRLWQIVQAEDSLRRRLSGSFAAADPEPIAGALQASAARLLEARDLFGQGEPALPCRLGTIGALDSGTAIYIGLLPPRSWVPPEREFEPEDAFLIRREIEPLIRRALATTTALDVPRILDALARQRSSHGLPGRAYEALAAMLIGH